MFKNFMVCAVFLGAATAAVSQTPVACSNISVGTNGSLNGFVPSPNDAWHQDITNAPIDPNSAKITTTSGDLLGAHLHPDFSSIAAGGYGIPYAVVDSSQTPSTAVPITLYPDESDITLVPIPSTLPIEGSPGECPAPVDDRHALVLDRNKCVIYELWQTAHCNSAWSASQMTVWDINETEKRPYTYTSADAAGLSVFEGLIRYDEIVAGVINHAIRFTAQKTKSDAHIGYFTAPATHAAGNLSTSDNIMGMRIRLRADYDISGFSSTNQIILKAMKQYGMILADNGSNLFFQGTPDSRWNDNDLNALKVVPATAFDVIQMGTVYESTTVPTGAAPVINSFTASASTVASGTAVTLTPTVTGASYSYIDNAGFTRGPVTVTPTATTTYTLTSRNAFGTASASVTVTVQAGIAPTLQFAAIPTQTFGAAAFAVSATSNSTGAITYSVVSGPATVSGNTVTITGAGTVTLQASQAAAGNYTAGTVQTSFAVNPASPTLAFVSVPTQTFGVAAFAVSTTTNSSGSIVYSVVSGPATVSGNQVTVTGTGSVTLQANQAAAGNYTAGVAQTTFTVNPAIPALTFATIPNQTFGSAPFVVSATSPSSGSIAYSVVSGPATISGNTVTLTGTGTVTLQASQTAAGNYTAGTVQTSFAVNPASPTLAFVSVPTQTFGAAAFAVSATSNSTGAITYSVVSGPATISGNTVTITGAGTVTLQASQAAAGNYTAGTVQTSFAVNPASPTLAFVSVPTQTFGAAAFAVSATSNSTGAITYSVVSGPATVSGSTVTLTGAGTVTLRASQAAAGNYTAGTVQTTFAVNPAIPALTFATIPNQTFGSAPFVVSATSPSSGSIAYSVVSGPATISGNTVTLTGTGTVTLQASQAAAGNYTSATATTSFSVAAATGTTAPKLAFVPNWGETFGAAPFTISATSASPGAITYSIASGPGTISGSTVTLTGGGTLVVQATQAASGSYASATTTMSIPVKAGLSGLAFVAVPNPVYGIAPFSIAATTKSSAAIVYSVTSGPATVSGNIVTLTGIGYVYLQATQAATSDYVAATATTYFIVAPQVPTLTFTAIPDQTFGNAPVTLNATSNSPAPITYLLVGGWALVSGNTVTLERPGILTFQARQAAVGNFAAATAQISFNVAAEPVTLAFAAIPAKVYGTSPPFAVSATSASPNVVTYSVVSGPATISGNTVTLTGAGTVTLAASQPAAGNYGAGTATTSFTVQ